MYGEGVHGPVSESVTSLVRVAVESDGPARLIGAAQELLGQPLGLAGPAGEALGRAPDTETGERALAIARAAATNRLVAPPGWRILSINRASVRFGFLAIGDGNRGDHRGNDQVELLSTLLADQLQRVALLRARAGELLRRLLGDPDLGPARARREAAECGLELAGAYWPAMLGWCGRAPRPDVAATLDAEAFTRAGGALNVALGEQMILLHPGGGAEAGERALEWFRSVAGRAQRLAPSARPQVIVGERALPLDELSAGVAELGAVWRTARRGANERSVVSVRHYALDRLLARFADTEEARDFVRRQIGPLIAWEEEHQGDLLSVLETGLDFPRHDVAAARCFMHRNTFRHRLRHAVDVLGDPLEDPAARLAVHVALKLHRAPDT